jgi:hypothetical protein
MAALLYDWFNHLIFRATQLRQADLVNKTLSQDKHL